MPPLLFTRPLAWLTAAVLVVGSVFQLLWVAAYGYSLFSSGSLYSSASDGLGVAFVATTLTKLVGAWFLLPLWFALTYVNLRRLGAAGLRYTPGQAWVGFYVPFLNMVRPYRALAEIWHASDPGLVTRGAYDRAGWLSTEGTPLLAVFWTAFVGGWTLYFLPVVPFRMFLEPLCGAVAAASLVFLMIQVERRLAALKVNLAGGPSLASSLGHTPSSPELPL